ERKRLSSKYNPPPPQLVGVFHFSYQQPGGRMQHILPALIPLVETARVDYTPATTGDEPDHKLLVSHH
ncbi:hypothetical protein PZH39_16965, partial [Desulfovibrio desulfuricans]|uniref:hypothetical protein n=1 Tax=Desulfovibrio desulfuricans TaxID=876 RepID=UPI0023B10C63